MGLSRCSSGSSLRRLGGTVVMRIFTVASAELISNPVSLVSMVRTAGRGGEPVGKTGNSIGKFRRERAGIPWGKGGNSMGGKTGNSMGEKLGIPQEQTHPSPSLGSCALRLSTTLFPKAATASTGGKGAGKGFGAGPGTEGHSDPAQGTLTGGKDLEDHHQVGHVVPCGHGALLVGAHLANLLDLLGWRKQPQNPENSTLGGGQHHPRARSIFPLSHFGVSSTSLTMGMFVFFPQTHHFKRSRGHDQVVDDVVDFGHQGQDGSLGRDRDRGDPGTAGMTLIAEPTKPLQGDYSRALIHLSFRPLLKNLGFPKPHPEDLGEFWAQHLLGSSGSQVLVPLQQSLTEGCFICRGFDTRKRHLTLERDTIPTWISSPMVV